MDSNIRHESEGVADERNSTRYNHISIDGRMGTQFKTMADVVQGSQAMMAKRLQTSYKCGECGRMFTEKSNLTRHEKTHIYQTYCIKCKVCEKTFTRREHLKRHLKLHSDVSTSSGSITMGDQLCSNPQAGVKIKQDVQTVTNQGLYICDVCKKMFTKKSHLTRHARTHNLRNHRHKCEVCGKIYTREEHLKRHFKLHSDVPYRLPQHNRKCKPMQHLNTFSVIKINPTLEAEHDMQLFMKGLKLQIHGHLLDHIGDMNALKWYGRLCCIMIRGKPETVLVRKKMSNDKPGEVKMFEGESEEMVKSEVQFEDVYNPDENREVDKFYFNCTTQLLLRDDEVEGQLATAFAEINNRFEEFTERGSGWQLKQIITFELNLAKYIGLTSNTSVRSNKRLKATNSL